MRKLRKTKPATRAARKRSRIKKKSVCLSPGALGALGDLGAIEKVGTADLPERGASPGQVDRGKPR